MTVAIDPGTQRLELLGKAFEVFDRISLPALQRRYGSIVVRREVLLHWLDRSDADELETLRFQEMFLDKEFQDEEQQEFTVLTLLTGALRAANYGEGSTYAKVLDAAWGVISFTHPTDFGLPEDFWSATKEGA